MKQKKELTGKRVLKIALLVVIGAIFLFCFMLYATVKTKSTSLSKITPFQEIINKPLTLVRDVELFVEEFPSNDDFPNLITDRYQRNYQNLHERLTIEEPDAKFIVKIPAG